MENLKKKPFIHPPSPQQNREDTFIIPKNHCQTNIELSFEGNTDHQHIEMAQAHETDMFQETKVGVQLCTHFCLTLYFLKGSVQEYVHMDLMSVMWAEIYFAFPSGEVQLKRLVHLVQSRLWTLKNTTRLIMHSNQNVLKYTAPFLTSFRRHIKHIETYVGLF